MPSPYALARESYALLGVDTEAALATLAATPVSLHCWQGDDVGGFEQPDATLSGGGIQATGNHPGKARTPTELRADLDHALARIPGTHRLNLHASYADPIPKGLDRDGYTIAQFQSWVDWCKDRGMGLDFNPTCFSHPLAADGLTLTHSDPSIRRFWIRHAIACRRIAAEMGRQLGTATVTNVRIPDGAKDRPVDRKGPRERLAAALDEIFAEPISPAVQRDAVESKLFGIGSECYVAGSHEFYLGYAITRQKMLCLDAGHFHPTEDLSDKVSSVLAFVPEILLHVSRGVRWDSDHVVLLDDPTRALFQEIVRGDYLGRTRIGLDFFDASINRIAAWVIGARNVLKALLLALLEPVARLRDLEVGGDLAGRLALLEDLRSLPWGAVWEEHCLRRNVPGDGQWMDGVREYERTVLTRRS